MDYLLFWELIRAQRSHQITVAATNLSCKKDANWILSDNGIVRLKNNSEVIFSASYRSGDNPLERVMSNCEKLAVVGRTNVTLTIDMRRDFFWELVDTQNDR
jgi:hypothetical protein